MPKDVILTPEGLEKLKTELDTLSTERRREVAERIKEAREFGDISENSEYDDAKNEQAMLEARIASVQEKLRMATVIEPDDLSTEVVTVGSVVHVKDEDTGKSSSTRSSARPRPSRPRTASPTSRRSDAPCSDAGARTSSRSRYPRARPASSRSPRSRSGSGK